MFRAPGRVNLIGEHTDYNLGFVLPMAIDMACFAASSPNGDSILRVHSVNLDQHREWSISMLSEVTPQQDWTDYIAGIARELKLDRGFDLMLESTVPFGAGLSSSAAFEVSAALALGWQGSLPSLELAQLCQRADNQFLGIPSGIMDQYVSIFGRSGAALKLDCRSLHSEVVELPNGIALVAVDSRIHHRFQAGSEESGYQTRVHECAAAAAILGVKSLRDASLGRLKEISDQCLQRRVRHVLTENLRVLSFAAACRHNDVPALGQLMLQSHRSLRDDYDVSCPEIDFLVEAAMTIQGVWGARLTGGGFGGSTINLMQPAHVEHFQETLHRLYRQKFGLEAEFHAITPSSGAAQIS